MSRAARRGGRSVTNTTPSSASPRPPSYHPVLGVASATLLPPRPRRRLGHPSSCEEGKSSRREPLLRAFFARGEANSTSPQPRRVEGAPMQLARNADASRSMPLGSTSGPSGRGSEAQTPAQRGAVRSRLLLPGGAPCRRARRCCARSRSRPQARDSHRTAYLARCGIHVVRFENREVLANLEGVLTEIARCLATPPRPQSPRPLTTPSSPPLSRGLSHPSSSEEGI